MKAMSIAANTEALITPSPAPTKGRGVCAVVLYDYEAEEENEMALAEGETIEQIEQIDEGKLIHIHMCCC